MIGVKVSQKGNAPAVLKSLPANIRGSARKAMRDTLKHVRAEIVRETVSKYYVTASRVRKAMTVEGTSIKVSGTREGIEKYKVSPTRPGKRQRSVMGAVKKDGLKPLGNNVFLMRSGSKYIPMARTTRKRFPIVHVISPAIPQIVSNPESMENVGEDMQAYFGKRLEYWTMQQIGAFKG